MSPNATIPPRIPPAPMAADRIAAPDSPVPNCSIAISTNSTSHAPISSMRDERIATISRASGCSARARNPPRIAGPRTSGWSSSAVCSAASYASSERCGAPAWAWGRSPSTRTAAVMATSARRASTAPGPATDRIAAADSGPSSRPLDSAMLVTALAAVSSDGSWARPGRSALCAGRTRVSVIDAAIAAR